MMPAITVGRDYGHITCTGYCPATRIVRYKKSKPVEAIRATHDEYECHDSIWDVISAPRAEQEKWESVRQAIVGRKAREAMTGGADE